MPAVADIARFPAFEVEFAKDGTLVRPADVADAAAWSRAGGITDLFAMSHGWNNDMAEARDLYARFFAQVRAVLDGPAGQALAGRRFAVLGFLWPSKKFAERDLIPSGSASVNDGSGAARRQVEAQLAGLHGFFDAPDADAALERARALVPRLGSDPAARKGFVDAVRSALPPPGPDPEGAPDRFRGRDGDALIDQFRTPVVVAADRAGSAAAGLGDLFGRARDAIVDAGQSAADAAGRVLNLATYYQMKERAGTAGLGGAYRVLLAIRQAPAPAVRIHLIGHSFGARLVTAATLGPDGGPLVRPESLTLLQAAFSHNGFSGRFGGSRVGFFRRVLTGTQVAGPILVSHTAHDWAVGLAYALASRVAGQTGASLGDANDLYGGLGRNGARNTAEAVDGTLGSVGTAYSFARGRVYNLHADVISGHGDIAKPEVAAALLAAVRTT